MSKESQTMSTTSAASDFLQRYQLSPLELRLARRQRLTAGLFYGLLLSTVYAVFSGTVNLITFPDLPLGIDWPVFAREVLITMAGGLALSLLTAWPANPWKGILIGSAAIAGFELLRSFLQVGATGLILLLLALPLMAVSFPIAAVYRWAVQQHLQRAKGHPLWRLGLVLAVVALGLFAGSWSRMPADAEAGVRRVHNMVRATLASGEGELPMSLRTIPDFRARAGQSYRLSQRASAASTTGIEVLVMFDNGYVITCFVDTLTNSSLCGEGTQSPFGPSRYNALDQR